MAKFQILSASACSSKAVPSARAVKWRHKMTCLRWNDVKYAFRATQWRQLWRPYVTTCSESWLQSHESFWSKPDCFPCADIQQNIDEATLLFRYSFCSLGNGKTTDTNPNNWTNFIREMKRVKCHVSRKFVFLSSTLLGKRRKNNFFPLVQM